MEKNPFIEHHNYMENLIENLLKLNPILANKNPQELVDLVNVIHECGYEWDKNKKIFYNKEVKNAIRAQGLDLFNEKRFKEKHEFWKKRNAIPEYIEFVSLAENFKKVFYLIIFYALLGWIIIPFKIWLISLVSIFVAFTIMKVLILERKMKISEKIIRDMKSNSVDDHS